MDRDFHADWLQQRTVEERQALEFFADMVDCRDEADEGLEPATDTIVEGQ